MALRRVGWVVTSTLIRWLGLVWAGPWTIVGLIFGALALATGGRMAFRGGVLEFWGGIVTWLLRHATPIGATALTLGHVVLAQSNAAAESSRTHELVHVAQYCRWGPLFVPVYVTCSAWVWWKGGRPYWDNPFELEARDMAGY